MSDLGWALNGDLELSPDRDLRITDETYYESIVQSVVKRITTCVTDWGLVYPMSCANLRFFAGEPNTRELGDNIKAAVRNALITDRIVVRDGIEVDAVPVALDAIKLTIVISAYIPRPIRMSIYLDFSRSTVIVGDITP